MGYIVFKKMIIKIIFYIFHLILFEVREDQRRRGLSYDRTSTL